MQSLVFYSCKPPLMTIDGAATKTVGAGTRSRTRKEWLSSDMDGRKCYEPQDKRSLPNNTGYWTTGNPSIRLH